MKRIPFYLILFRLSLAPAMPLLAIIYGPKAGILLAVLLILGVLSDVFDGIIARKLNLSTTQLRKLDSNADLLFMVSVLVSACLLYPQQVLEKWVSILLLVALEAIQYILCFVKFRKSPANHAYLSKFFAVIICLVLSWFLITGQWGWGMILLLIVGCVSYIDNYLILLLLKAYRVDTKSAIKAWRLRSDHP